MAGILQSLAAFRIYTHDLDRARQFYAQTLELEELASGQGYATFDLGGIDIVIETIEQDDPEAEYLVGRFVAASFRVADIATAYRQFGARGVSLVEPPELQPWGGTLASISDPDGNVLTLVEFPVETQQPIGKVSY